MGSSFPCSIRSHLVLLSHRGRVSLMHSYAVSITGCTTLLFKSSTENSECNPTWLHGHVAAVANVAECMQPNSSQDTILIKSEHHPPSVAHKVEHGDHRQSQSGPWKNVEQLNSESVSLPGCWSDLTLMSPPTYSTDNHI